MVDITIPCAAKQEHLASYGKGHRSNAEGIEVVRQQCLNQIKNHPPERREGKTVTVGVRKNLGMTEALFNRGGIHTDGQPMWDATCWPLDKALKGPAGSASSIACRTAPRCSAALRPWLAMQGRISA